MTVVLLFANCSGNKQTNNQQDGIMTQTKDTIADNGLKKVKITTSLGDIVVELYNETPKHRDNFLKLAKEGYYDGVLFHRVIRQFMIQTGDGDSKNADANTMLGVGGPGYNIDAEIVYPQYFHKKGALAAARQADQVNPKRESSGSQFYIVTGRTYSQDQLNQMQAQIATMRTQQILDSIVAPYRKDIMKMRAANDEAGLDKLSQELIAKAKAEYEKAPFSFTPEQVKAYTTIGGTPHLDGQYTVFGEVVSGMDVVEQIENAETGRADRPKNDIKIISMTILE